MSSDPRPQSPVGCGPTTQVTPVSVRAAGGEASLCLTVLHAADPGLVGTACPLTSEAVVLGRSPAPGGLLLADPTLSRQHAEIVRLPDGTVRLRDLSSRNGTFVNGQRVSDWPLCEGDLVRIGDNLILLSDLSLDGQYARRVELAAGIGMTVLLQGETGTGKEVTARKIHEFSGRKGAFVALNCGAVPADLITAELFGHAKGAFSGATQPRKGVFRAADGGTLLLDEVGDCPPQVQVALLRALEQRAVRPVGEEHEIPVRVTVIAATNKNLKDAVEAGRFRADLYARLAQYVIGLPPLRQRRSELLDLARELAREMGRELRFEVGAAEAMLLWKWPYNIRELRSLVGLFVRSHEADSPLDFAYLQEHVPELTDELVTCRTGGPQDPAPSESRIVTSRPPSDILPVSSRKRGRVSPDELIAALEQNEWSPERTAQSLGIPKSTVHYLMRSNPRVRRATDIGEDELREALARSGQDVDAAAAELRVSARALAMALRRRGLLAGAPGDEESLDG